MNDIKFIAIFLTSSCMMALVLIMVIQVGMGEGFLPDDCTLSGKNRNAPRIETCENVDSPEISGSPMIYSVGKPQLENVSGEGTFLSPEKFTTPEMTRDKNVPSPEKVTTPEMTRDKNVPSPDWSQFDLDIDEPADNGPTEDEKRKLMETLDGMELSENWDFSKRRMR